MPKGNLCRESNFELLRIVSMFLVLVVHADLFSLGYPTLDELYAYPKVVIAKGLIESISIICVNVFVLISGYFMIKLRRERIFSYIYQCLFYSISVYVFFLIFKLCEFNFSNTLQAILVGWFMKSQFVSNYLGLMLLSPLINIIFEKGSHKQINIGMLSFSFVAFVMNWLIPVEGGGFLGGYSIMHLAFIYCLGCYIRYCSSHKYLNYKTNVYLLVYVGFICLNTTVFLIFFRYSLPWNVWAYNSPIVVLGSIAFFLCFRTIKIHSTKINYIAKSSFAVLLLHTNFFIFPYFKKYMVFLYTNNEGLVFFIKAFIFLLLVFIVAILLDWFRKLTYNWLTLILNNKYVTR